MIKAILFDWDDVFITGSLQGYFECYHKTLSELRIKLNEREEKHRILENWGKHPKDELKGLLKEHPEKLDESYHIYENILLNSDTFIKHIKPIEGIKSVIDRLSKNYKLGLATGMNPKLFKIIMLRFDVPNKFSKIISAYDITEEGKQKPSPYMLNELIKYFKVKQSEAIFVGDAKSDVLMAINASIKPVVVLTGYLSKEEAQNLGVEYIIDDVTKIDEILSKISQN
jgi:HAD superfamily hydrolase (TIGR01549 family)